MKVPGPWGIDPRPPVGAHGAVRGKGTELVLIVLGRHFKLVDGGAVHIESSSAGGMRVEKKLHLAFCEAELLYLP